MSIFYMNNAQARRGAIAAVADAPQGYRVSIEPPKRNLEQNAKLWAALGEVSAQVNWHGQKLEPADWKDVFTASLKRQKVCPGIDGGFVVLGSSTSKMSKAEFSELLELVLAFGTQHGVHFHEPETA